jgi:hypothetical protein
MGWAGQRLPHVRDHRGSICMHAIAGTQIHNALILKGQKLIQLLYVP